MKSHARKPRRSRRRGRRRPDTFPRWTVTFLVAAMTITAITGVVWAVWIPTLGAIAVGRTVARTLADLDRPAPERIT